MGNVAIVILAAGAARRFGSPKQLTVFSGRPLLQVVVENCVGTGVPVYLVLGAHYQRVVDELDLSEVQVLFNSHWQEGMAASIRHGVSELAETFDALLYVAGDQPLVSSVELNAIIQLAAENPGSMCCASYGETIGIPAVFPKRYYGQLLALQGDNGAKKILLEGSDRLLTQSMPGAELDIDLPEDVGKNNLLQI